MRKAFVAERVYVLNHLLRRLIPHVKGVEGTVLMEMMAAELRNLRRGTVTISRAQGGK